MVPPGEDRAATGAETASVHDAVGAAAPARMGQARNVHEPASRRLFPLGRNIVPGGALSRHAGTGREAAKRGEHPPRLCRRDSRGEGRSEEHTSAHQSLMRISYAVFCLKTT